LDSASASIKVYRTLIFFSILISQVYILLYAVDFYRVMPEMKKLFSLSLFMRVDMGLGI
jgi:hypothetical protein